MVLILLIFQGYERTDMSAVAGIVLYYILPLYLLEFSELFLNEIVYHYLLFK
jgi:hypothetical protein